MNPFKTKCPECGKEVVTYIPNRPTFCSKICETNYKWRKNTFSPTQLDHTWDKDKTKQL